MMNIRNNLKSTYMIIYPLERKNTGYLFHISAGMRLCHVIPKNCYTQYSIKIKTLAFIGLPHTTAATKRKDKDFT